MFNQIKVYKNLMKARLYQYFSILKVKSNYINISKYIGIVNFFNKMLEINHKDYKHFLLTYI